MVKEPQDKPGKDKPTATPSASSAPVEKTGSAPETPAPGGGTVKKAAPEKKKETAGALWILAFLAIVIGGGYATLPLWSAYIPGLSQWMERDAGGQGAPRQQEKQPVRQAAATSDVERERDALNVTLGALIDRLGLLEQQLGDVRKMVDATALPDEVANASKSLEQLSGRLAKMEESNQAVGTVLDRLNRLEEGVSDVARSAAEPPAEMTAAIGEIAKRLDSLESGSDINRRQTAAQSNAQALVLAVGQLRQILPTGAPYSQALKTVLRMGGADAEVGQPIQVLQAHAETGVATLSALSRDYAGLVGELTATTPDPNEGFFSQTLNRLMSLVRISRVDGQGDVPASTGALADKVSQALRDGDLQTAVGILQDLKDPPARAREWTQRAEQRLAAERALALLNVYAVSLLAPAAE